MLRGLLSTFRRTAPHDRHVTQGTGDAVTRVLVGLILAAGVGYLITSVVMDPSKRNIQLTAGVIFLGLVLVAHPRQALLFSLAVVPFPGYTTVGSTSTLLIFAVMALVLVKSRPLHLPSPFVDKRTDIPLALFGLAAVLSLQRVPAEYLSIATLKLTGLLSAIALYYLIIQLTQTRQDLRALMRTVMTVAVLLCVIALLQYFFPTKQILPAFFKFSKKIAEMEEVRAGTIRAFATFPGFETFAEYVVFALFLQYALFRSTLSLPAKAYWMIAMMLAFGALFTTATRAGIVTLVLGISYAILNSGRAVPRGELLRVAFVGFALFYLSMPFLGNLYSFMLERLFGLADTGVGDDASVKGRMIVMEQALDAVARNPFSGVGFYDQPHFFRGHVGMNIHNVYVTIAHRIGLPGLVGFVWFVSRLYLDSLRALRVHQAPAELRGYLLFLNTCLFLLIVDQMKIEFVRDPLTMHTTFTLLAMVTVATRLVRRSAAGEVI